MNIFSWNVNGFRAILKKNFKQSIISLDLDIICLQETKVEENQLPQNFVKDIYFNEFHQYWFSAEKKGYSGVSILSKIKPINIIRGIGIEKFDIEGRVLTLEFEHFFLITTYFPNSQRELRRLDYKLEFNKEFLSFIKNLKQKKSVLLCGDLNVAHQKIDLTNPKNNINNPGFSIKERQWFTSLLDKGYIDIFRKQYPDKIAYTWWSYMRQAREKNIGWRIDYFICDDDFYSKVRQTHILKDIMGSDHCPVLISLDA